MKILINSDRTVDCSGATGEYIESTVAHALERFKSQLTRVEVHVGDMNGPSKGGSDDIRCLIEARLAGRDPTSVTHHAENLHKALAGAVDKIVRALDSVVGKAVAARRG